MLIIQVRIDRVFFPFAGLPVDLGAGDFRVLDIIPGFDQIKQIPLDGGPVDLESVLAAQPVRNLLLGHGVVCIRVFPQNLQNIKDDDLLARLLKHGRVLFSI
jgi:hypothetical protein